MLGDIRNQEVERLISMLYSSGTKGLSVKQVQKTTNWTKTEIFIFMGLVSLRLGQLFEIIYTENRFYLKFLPIGDHADYILEKGLAKILDEKLLETLAIVILLDSMGGATLSRLQKDRKKTVIQDLHELKKQGFISERNGKWQVTRKTKQQINIQEFLKKAQELQGSRQISNIE